MLRSSRGVDPVIRWNIIVAVITVGAMGAGCRVSAPIDPPTPVAEHEHAHVLPTPVPAPEPAPLPKPAPLPRPPPLQVFTPVTLPFEPDAIVVEPVHDQVPVVLFPDETRPIRRHAASALGHHGHTVLPINELERIETAAAEGRLRLEEDRLCRSPLTHADLMARYFASAPRAEVRASCPESCLLTVTVEDPNDEDAYANYTSRTIRTPHAPRAWARARLRPTDSLWGYLHGSMSRPLDSPPIRFASPESIGPWAKPPAGERLAEAEGKVAACAHPDARVEVEYEVRVAVGKSGKVDRCEATPSNLLGRPADALCLCEGIETIRYPRGRAGRRLRFTAIDDGQSGPFDVSLKPLQPGTDPWVQRLQQTPALATCLLEGRPDAGFTATVVLDLTSDGTIERVQVLGDIDTAPEMKFSECLVRELRPIPLPCAPPGIDALQVSVVFEERS